MQKIKPTNSLSIMNQSRSQISLIEVYKQHNTNNNHNYSSNNSSSYEKNCRNIKICSVMKTEANSFVLCHRQQWMRPLGPTNFVSTSPHVPSDHRPLIMSYANQNEPGKFFSRLPKLKIKNLYVCRGQGHI